MGGYPLLWLSRLAHQEGLDVSWTLLCVASAIFEAPGVATLWGFFLCCPKYMDELENGQICVADSSA